LSAGAARPVAGSAAGSAAGFDAALVDLDGTLVDTVGDFEAALVSALAELGLPAVPRAFVRDSIGKGSEHLIAQTLAAVGAPAAQAPALWRHYQRHYLAINGRHSAPYPGALAAMRELRAMGLRLGCVTNKPGAFVGPLLALTGLAPLFELAYGGDAFERKKPDPLPLRRACEALGTEPARTLMVGDSSNDAEAARAAGCPVVLVSYGYNHGRPAAEARPDALIDSLAELPALLQAGLAR
jgi:phosphoglycolate phosphatase